jgi:hypothetical protein
MNDDTTYTGIDEMDGTDSSLMRTYTQVVSCAVGKSSAELRRLSLRAKLERERYERQIQLDKTFSSTFRSLFKSG